MRRILFLLLLLPFVTKSQVINPVPDMVFKGQLSAGRSTKTDTSAYMAIGPARGANRGFMAPMVSDTNSVIQPRRDGLLIFSLQRRNFLYWDSLSIRWRDFGGASVDTLILSTRAWRQKGVDSVLSIGRITSIFSGLGMKFDTIKTSGSVSVDTIIMATRLRVQKSIDSLGQSKQNSFTLTTLGTTGPATLAGGVLNIPNYSPGSGFLRNLAPIGSVPNINGMSKFGDTLRLQPASVNFGGVVTTGTQTFGGEKIFNERIRVGVSGGATIQNTDQFTVGIGNNSLSSSLTTVSNNTAVGYNSGSTNVAGQNNVFLGSQAGSLISTGQNNTNSINGVFIGVDSRPLGDNQTNQIAIGQGSRGNGTNTTTIGNSSTAKTYLKGSLNVGVIDSLAPTANIVFANSSGDVTKSGRVPTSFIDTVSLSTRAWRQKGIDSVNVAKQNKLVLTTSGSSGSSSLSNDTLNVPTYTLSGLGGVPSSRFITINGISQDLSADRIWTVSAVTSVSAGIGMYFPTITSTGFVNADTMVLATRSRVQKVSDSLSSLISGGGLGTVTSVAAGTGMSFTTITNSGSVNADTLTLSTRAWRNKAIDTLIPLINAKGVGTVTSVSSGFGTDFSTITSTGSVVVDSSVMATRSRVQKAVDSINNVNASGTGISGYMTRWSGTKTMDTSQMFQLANRIGVGTTSPVAVFDVPGSTDGVRYGRFGNLSFIEDGNGPTIQPADRALTVYGQSNVGFIYGSVSGGTGRFGINTRTTSNVLSVAGNVSIGFDSASTSAPENGLKVQGRLRVNTMDSTSSAINLLYQDIDGTIKKSSVPAGGSVDSAVYSTKAWRQKGIDSVVNLIANAGGGTVLSVSSGTGMNFSTITTTGSVSADTVILATRARAQKAVDSLSSVKQNNISLTTTGNSGASTFSSSVLNVPNYTLSGLGGVPTTRNLTINGTQFDLSADRSWTISSGSGTVTSVAAGAGMNFSTITTTGTVSADTVALSTRAWRQKGIDSVVNLIANSGGGTVLSVAAGTGMSFSTITTTGSVAADTSILATRARVQKPVDSLGSIKQNNISLTTTGSSGASTFISNVLNVPNYTLSGLGGVPTSRNITINGATYDLSADRTWTISAGTGTVTSVASGVGMNFSTITSTGTVSADTNTLATRAWRQKGIDSVNSVKQDKISLTTTGSSGASTLVGSTLNVPNYTLSGLGGVPTSRTITINGTTYDLSSDRTWTVSGGGTGTVTSVTGGYGLTGGTITVSGTLALDTAAMATRSRVQKGIDSVAALPRITGTGVSGYMARWTGASTQDTSRIFQSGNLVGINTTSPTERLDVDGKIRARVIDSSASPINMLWSDASGVIRKTAVPAGGTVTSVGSGFGTNFSTITTTGSVSVDSVIMATRARVQKAIDSLQVNINAKGSGTVTSVATGYGLTGGTITTTGTIVADTNLLSSREWRQKAVDTINATRVPNGRTLTINGTSFDLSANRTWTIATGADMDTTSLSIASGWQFARDLTTADAINELAKTNKGEIRTITLQAVVYKTTNTFSTGSWVTVATVPSGWRPNHTVYGSLPNLVTGTEYENISGTDFADDAFYEGACAYRILTNGNVQVRVDTVTSSATLSGANYVIFPIHIVYIVQYIPV